MDEPIRQVGRYRLVREIGRGGMAAVYLASQVDLDRDVALKELNAFHAADPAFAERFVRESRVAGSMQHPNIVTVYEFLNEDGTPYIAMEYLERGSLRPYVGKTTLAQTIGVLEGALAGLAQAERREIVHRDIKPENLMVTSDGEVKIADFGIAKALTDAGGPNLTATGTTVGTPAYMAPEQATAGDVGPWTDLYSVGITAYEMTVDRVPFHDSTTPVAVLMRQVSEEIPSAVSVDPSVDRRFSDWIDRLLVKDPAKRTQSAREAWYELEEIAVAALGPLWRREARLLVSGTDRAAGPLTPAPFDRQTPPPQEAGSGYETYLGESPAAAPPPPPPPPQRPDATLPGQPVPPAAAAAAGQATAAPAAAAPAAIRDVPVAGPEPQQPPSDHPGVPGRDRRDRRRGLPRHQGQRLVVVRVGDEPDHEDRRNGDDRPKLPTVTAVPAQFEPGNLQSVSAFDGHAWAMHKPEEIVDLSSSGTTVPVQMGNGRFEPGVRRRRALGEQHERRRPARSAGSRPGSRPPSARRSPTAARRHHPGRSSAAARSGSRRARAWSRSPEGGGSPQQVQGIDVRAVLRRARRRIDLGDRQGRGTWPRCPLATPKPIATVVTLPSPGKDVGWIAGDDSAVYVTTATGVTQGRSQAPDVAEAGAGPAGAAGADRRRQGHPVDDLVLAAGGPDRDGHARGVRPRPSGQAHERGHVHGARDDLPHEARPGGGRLLADRHGTGRQVGSAAVPLHRLSAGQPPTSWRAVSSWS